MAKVYCVNCIYFSAGEPVPPSYDFGPPSHQLEKCLSPSNFKDTHAEEKSLPVSQPRVINRWNNCIWYSPKPGDSSSSSSAPLAP